MLPLCLSLFLILSPCSGVGPSHRLQSFGMSLLHGGFSAWTAVTVRNLLQNGPFTDCSVIVSFSVVFFMHWREIPAPLWSSLWAAGEYLHFLESLPHSFCSYLAVHRVVSLSAGQHFTFFFLHYNRNVPPWLWHSDVSCSGSLGALWNHLCSELGMSWYTLYTKILKNNFLLHKKMLSI